MIFVNPFFTFLHVSAVQLMYNKYNLAFWLVAALCRFHRRTGKKETAVVGSDKWESDEEKLHIWWSEQKKHGGLHQGADRLVVITVKTPKTA